MPIATVLLVGPAPAMGWSALARRLAAAGLRALTAVAEAAEPAPRDRALAEAIARTAVAIQAAAPTAPVLLVAAGEGTDLLPRLGLAQRAARRAVAGYVLIDPDRVPTAAGDWPDAPVTVVRSPGASAASHEVADAAGRRGWDVVDADPASALADVCRRS